MNDFILIASLANNFSENDLLVILRNISSDVDASDYLIKIFASAYTFSWIEEDTMKDILKKIDEDWACFMNGVKNK